MTIKIKVKCICGGNIKYNVLDLSPKVDIELGMLFGHKMVLKDVPEERAKHVEKLAKKHMERMAVAYHKETFGAFDRDMEIVKSLRNQ